MSKVNRLLALLTVKNANTSLLYYNAAQNQAKENWS